MALTYDGIVGTLDTQNNGGTTSLTLTAGVAVGKVLLLVIAAHPGNTILSTDAVTDDSGNTWLRLEAGGQALFNGSSYDAVAYMFGTKVTTALNSGDEITVVHSSTTGARYSLHAVVVGGVTIDLEYAKEASTVYGNTTPDTLFETHGNLKTFNPNCFALSWHVCYNDAPTPTVSIGTPWIASGSQQSNGTVFALRVGYRILTTLQTDVDAGALSNVGKQYGSWCWILRQDGVVQLRADFSGTGASTEDAHRTSYQDVDLVGSGTLLSDLSGLFNFDATLAGEGTLTLGELVHRLFPDGMSGSAAMQAELVWAIAAQLASEGTMDAVLAGGVIQPAADLAGEGVMAAALVGGKVNLAAALSGAGDMIFALPPHFRIAAHLCGHGTIGTDESPSFIAEVGRVAACLDRAWHYARSADLSGDGSLTASLALTSGLSAALGGGGDLSASLAGGRTALAADLSGAGTFEIVERKKKLHLDIEGTIPVGDLLVVAFVSRDIVEGTNLQAEVTDSNGHTWKKDARVSRAENDADAPLDVISGLVAWSTVVERALGPGDHVDVHDFSTVNAAGHAMLVLQFRGVQRTGVRTGEVKRFGNSDSQDPVDYHVDSGPMDGCAFSTDQGLLVGFMVVDDSQLEVYEESPVPFPDFTPEAVTPAWTQVTPVETSCPPVGYEVRYDELALYGVYRAYPRTDDYDLEGDWESAALGWPWAAVFINYQAHTGSALNAQWAAEADLEGNGYLNGLLLGGLVEMEAALAGEGILTPLLRLTIELEATLAGEGTLTETIRVARRLAAALSGAGDMSASARLIIRLVANLSANGSMSAETFRQIRLVAQILRATSFLKGGRTLPAPELKKDPPAPTPGGGFEGETFPADPSEDPWYQNEP